MSPASRLVLTAIFALLLALPALVRQWQGAPPESGLDHAALLARHGFYLEEVSRSCGVDFTHAKPRFDQRLDPIMPQIAALGASVSVADFDRDGFPDFYVTRSAEGSKNALYHNLGNGMFEDVAGRMGVADLNLPGTGCSTGSIWCDVDNDGFEDLLVLKWGKPLLFHNDGGKGFSRIENAGLPDWVNASSAIGLDFDRDGRIDLLISGYFDERIDLWHLLTTRIMPESFEYAQNGGRKYLLRNKGNGTFEDVTASMGITSRRWALAAAASDVFGSGYPDIFIANDYGVSELYRNQAGHGFQEVGKAVWIAEAPKSGMNATFGDVFDQGRQAVYVSNISEPGVLIQGNNLWVPRQGGSNGRLFFENMAQDLGVGIGGWSFGAQFGDLNNDGALDLYLVNGYISADPESSYWYDFSKVAGAHREIISDAANWPPMRGRSLAGYQSKKVWVNDGKGRFTDVAQAVGVTDRYDGRAVAMADLWNRGALDVLVANQGGPLLIYKNHVAPENAWITLDLEGTRSNRSAIGARVTVEFGARMQVQEVTGGSGFAAQNDRRLHFGLGKGVTHVRVKIRWPAGCEQTLDNVAVNRFVKVKEPS